MKLLDVFTIEIIFKSGNVLVLDVVQFNVTKAHDNSITGMTYELYNTKQRLLYTHLDSIACVIQHKHRKVFRWR
jgi:hypothetical protein